MAASQRTIQQLKEVLIKHLYPELALEIVQDLEAVPGNKSFKDTIRALRIELEKEQK